MLNLDIVEQDTEFEALKNLGGLITDHVTVSGSIANGAKIAFTKSVALPSGTEFVQGRVRRATDSGKLFAMETWLSFNLTVGGDVWIEPSLKITGSVALIVAEVINQSGGTYSITSEDVTFYLRPFVSPF